ncbi:hypothetical protein [Petrachloros mirabilis]
MGIFTIGVVTLVLLIWTLVWSLGIESNAEKRRQNLASQPSVV